MKDPKLLETMKDYRDGMRFQQILILLGSSPSKDD